VIAQLGAFALFVVLTIFAVIRLRQSLDGVG